MLLLQTVYLPIFSVPLFFVELSFPAPVIKSQNSIIDQPEPSKFTFHANWTGTITNYPVRSVFPTVIKTERRNAEVVYGGDITEMKYFNNQIDYKANFDEENECEALPRQQQEDFEQLSQ